MYIEQLAQWITSHELAALRVGSIATSVCAHFKMFTLKFENVVFEGLLDALTAFRFPYLLQKKFVLKISLSKPCQMAWADFTLSGRVLY